MATRGPILLCVTLLAAGACRAADPGSRSPGRPSGPSASGSAPGADPGVARARERLLQGIERVQAGQLEEGLEALHVAGESAAEDVRLEAHRWRGHALTQRGDPEGALEEYQAALQLSDSDPWLHYAVGLSWNTMGEDERAEQAFSRALERNPCHVKALQWRAEVRRLRADFPASLADLSRALACIEEADEVALADFGPRRELLSMTLVRHIEVLEALGRSAEADRDRRRRETLLSGS